MLTILVTIVIIIIIIIITLLHDDDVGDENDGGVMVMINTLRLRQNARHFPDDIFECIFFLE